MILVEDRDVVRWLLHEAERAPRKAFNSFAPFYCKLCDEPVPPRAQRQHVAAHRRELVRLVEEIRRTAVIRLREVSRLRREARR